MLRPGCVRLCGLLALGLWLAAGGALADDKTEAKRHFEAGLVFFEADNYTAAATEFEASVKLYPTKMGWLNLANCMKALFRYGEALEAIDGLERDLGRELDQKWKADIAAFRSEVRDLSGELTVRAAPDGAMIELDGREVGLAPLGRKLVLPPGEHEVAVSKAGFVPERRTAKVVSRGHATVEIALEAEKVEEPPAAAPAEPPPPAPPPPAPAPAPLPPPEEGGLSGWFWAGLSLTVAAGAVSGVMYGLAAKSAGDYEDAKTDYEELSPSSEGFAIREDRLWSDMDEARGDVELFSKVGLGAAIAAGAFAVGTAVALGVGLSGGSENPPVAVRPAGAGLALEF
jgi:tetratricopeptide (TPR) repeat protein